MEIYTINGVQVEYDTFDLDNMEKFHAEVQKVSDDMNALQERMKNGESPIALLREQANRVLDFFDDILGDGHATKIFGDRVNILEIANGYKAFTAAVGEAEGKLGETLAGTGMNREQRRAAARAR